MEYQIRRLSFEDGNKSLIQLVELQQTVHGTSSHNFSVEGFRHFYLDNPYGKVISYNAFYEDQLVAHYACIPVKMKIGQEIVDGLLDIATATHPDHRGKGLFKTLAKYTFEYAAECGFKFVIGVANANSFPGYMKHLNFTFISQLNVMWGWGDNIFDEVHKKYSLYWNLQAARWRLNNPQYNRRENIIWTYIRSKYLLGIKLLLGSISHELQVALPIKNRLQFLYPFNLYIGLGANTSAGFYFKFPRFIKRSPFNLIFLDLTSGELPPIDKDNIFFQLMDFDVA